MEHSLREVGAGIRDDAGDDETESLREFVRALRTESDESLRLVVRYRGDRQRLLYVRDDVEAETSADDLDERIRTLTLRGIGDSPRESVLDDFGTLEATLRWYDEVLVATFPYREWSGVIAVFERGASAVVERAVDRLRERD
jgi:hypothetical protein